MNGKLGFGLMRLPSTDPKDPGKIDIKQCCDMVDMFLDRGFNYFDTAWMYCNFKSEDAVKDILTSRHARDGYTITTKLHSGFINTKEDRDKIFDTQRQKMGTDYLDYYWLHDVNTHSIEVYNKLDCWSWLQDKKKAGDVKHIGFSFHDGPELLDKVLTEHPEIEYVQLQINYLDWNSSGVRSRECYEVATKHGKPVIVMEPVKGGMLANMQPAIEEVFKARQPEKSTASWALRFVGSLPGVMTILSGMSNEEQMLDNINTFKNFEPLAEDEFKLVDEVTEKVLSTPQIGCTACRYCCDGCPMKISIPDVFRTINTLRYYPNDWRAKAFYSRVSQAGGKASDCIGCGQCERVCPQHLPIIDLMKEAAEILDT